MSRILKYVTVGVLGVLFTTGLAWAGNGSKPGGGSGSKPGGGGSGTKPGGGGSGTKPGGGGSGTKPGGGGSGTKPGGGSGTKPGGGGSGTKPGGGGSGTKPGGSSTKDLFHHHHHGHHGHHGKHWHRGHWWTGDGEWNNEYQDVRFLVIKNETGEDLTIYVRLPEDGRTFRWNFAAGETSYLAIDGERIVASEALVWAEGGSKVWNKYKEENLVLVTEPYRSNSIGTFTYTLNP